MIKFKSMKKFIYLIFIGLIIISCKQKSEKNPEKPKLDNVDAQILKSVECTPYFDFDEVDYYFTNISDEEVLNLNETKNDSLLFNIINRRIFSKISDSIFIPNLESVGFNHKIIDKEDFRHINDFLSICDNETIALACAPFYRDILIFRKSEKIVGIAKICFSCGQSLIINQTRELPPLDPDKNWREFSTILKKLRVK